MKVQFANIWYILNIYTFQQELVVCHQTRTYSGGLCPPCNYRHQPPSSERPSQYIILLRFFPSFIVSIFHPWRFGAYIFLWYRAVSKYPVHKLFLKLIPLLQHAAELKWYRNNSVGSSTQIKDYYKCQIFAWRKDKMLTIQLTNCRNRLHWPHCVQSSLSLS